MNEWEEVTLGDIISIKGGFSYRGEFIGSGDSLLLGMGCVSFNETFLDGGARSYSGDCKDVYLIRPGEIVIATRQQSDNLPILGAPAILPDKYVNEKVIVGTNLYQIFNQSELDNDFLFWLLRSPSYKSHILSRSKGTTVRMITKDAVESFTFKCPPKLERNKISKSLWNIQTKIELNRQMNQTLEAMAQALFKSWFVDFDPVIDNALTAGNEIPEELQGRAEKRKGLSDSKKLLSTNPSLAALFPSSFVFNEVLGKWIPEGWEVKKLESISPCNKNSWTNRNSPKQVDYVDLSNTKNGDILETTIYSYEEAPSRAKRILKIGDTIFGTVRPGNRSFAYIGKDGLTGSTGFAVLSPSKIEYRAFTYLYATQEEMIELFAHLADGAAYPSINSSVIAESHIVYSGDVLLSRFENLAGSNISKMMSNKIESETLTQLRDRLLPELISGRVSVKGH